MQETLSGEQVNKILRGEYVPQRKPRYAYDHIEITVPLPPAACSPNARCHWTKKAKAVAKQREDAKTAALLELGRFSGPRWERAEIEATFHKPSKRAKRADDDNLTASLKAARDGLQDAGIVVSDAGFTMLPPKQLLGADATEAKVVLVITERRDA